MKLELRFEELSGAEFSVREYDPDVDNMLSILDDVCARLKGRSTLVVSGFGQDQWPMDTSADLSIFLEQLPDLLTALFSGLPAELDFYEQGVERVITFTPDGAHYVLSCTSATHWQPEPGNARMSRFALERMFANARWEFIRIVQDLSPDLLSHPWMKAWIDGQMYWGPPTRSRE